MSKFEIILIVLVCLVPFFTFIILFKKKNLKDIFKKKEKTKNLEQKEEKVAEIKPEPIKEQPKPEPTKTNEYNNEISTDEFKSYLSNRPSQITKPERKVLPDNFQDRTMPYSQYVQRPKRIPMQQKPKNVAEEIQQLSPELKALMLSGFLDKKNYN